VRLPTLVAGVDRALKTLGTPAGGEVVLLALSGGADSVALLDALCLLRRPRGFQVAAAHLDHRLRPGSGDDAAFCRALCERLDVLLHVGEADVAARVRREGGGLEQAARRERYGFLRRVQRETGAVAIAVAHTRDDQAETLLLHLLRGSGATGLGGMRPRVGPVVRPLLGLSRREVVAHLRERGLAWRDDPTNADPALLRNRVRHELLPYLEARFNPRLRGGLARTARLLAEEAAYLRARADALLDRIARPDGDALVLERSGLARAPAAVARVAIRQALSRAGGLSGVRAVHVERILALAGTATAGQLPLPGGREVRYRRGVLRVEARPAAPTGDESGLGRET
jgi:tRNA(Ile)-lysidine synthase